MSGLSKRVPAGDALRERIVRDILPGVEKPGQYLGGERHSIVKDHTGLSATFCFAFPDTYALGMSHHGLEVLYTLVNAVPDLACERVFCPMPDFEAALRRHHLPLYGLETFTPIDRFDVLGFSLQYEVCYTNILTMLDLGGIPLLSAERTGADPLVIAGGPGAQNPEVLAPFIDLFVIGDGEETLLELLRLFGPLKKDSALDRHARLVRLAERCPWAYVPGLYEPHYAADGTLAELTTLTPTAPKQIAAAVIATDFDEVPIPTRPIVPLVETVHERIAIEIMRGCPWKCRFCQSTTIKRPLRVRSVERIVAAAKEAYQNTGYDEISILSLSSSDYPFFEVLVRRLGEEFAGLGVNISVPSLRVNEQLRGIPALMRGNRTSGLTLAPEVARDDMRDQIKKPIDNADLFEGCREAFREGFGRVKLYFMCGLPGERTVDLDGIVELAERIARIGKEVTGRFAQVTASVSNFVPKPHTPYQWNGMQTREYFEWAHRYLKQKVRLKCVRIKCHHIDRSLLEGVLTRGDRRIAPAILEVWRRGGRLDAWTEYFDPELWWSTFRDLGIEPGFFSERARPHSERLPWDHIDVQGGRGWLEKDHDRSVVQLTGMVNARDEGFEMDRSAKKHTPKPNPKFALGPVGSASGQIAGPGER